MGANTTSCYYGVHSGYQKSRKYQLCSLIVHDKSEQGSQLLKEWEELFFEKCDCLERVKLKLPDSHKDYMQVLCKLAKFQSRIEKAYSIVHR